MFNIKKANKLRKEANKQASLERLFEDKWDKEISNSPKKTPAEIKKINKKNQQLVDAQAKKADAAYNDYYDYVHKNKPKKEIDDAMKKAIQTKLGFSSRLFLDELNKKTERSKGNGKKKYCRRKEKK